MSKNKKNIDISDEMYAKINEYRIVLTDIGYAKNKDGSNKKVSYAMALDKILNEFFEDTILKRDYIPLNKPLYFINKGHFIKPIEAFDDAGDIKERDLHHTYIIHKVPNNLDTFSTKYNKYCYNNQPNRHRGVYIYYELKDIYKTYEKSKIERHLLLFDYIAGDDTGEITPKLTIKPVMYFNNLRSMIGDYNQSINKLMDDLFKEWNKYPFNICIDKRDTYKDIDRDITFIEDINYLDKDKIRETFNILEPLKEHMANKTYYLESCYKMGDYNAEYNPQIHRLDINFNGDKLVTQSDILQSLDESIHKPKHRVTFKPYE